MRQLAEELKIAKRKVADGRRKKKSNDYRGLFYGRNEEIKASSFTKKLAKIANFGVRKSLLGLNDDEQQQLGGLEQELGIPELFKTVMSFIEQMLSRHIGHEETPYRNLLADVLELETGPFSMAALWEMFCLQLKKSQIETPNDIDGLVRILVTLAAEVVYLELLPVWSEKGVEVIESQLGKVSEEEEEVLRMVYGLGSEKRSIAETAENLKLPIRKVLKLKTSGVKGLRSGLARRALDHLSFPKNSSSRKKRAQPKYRRNFADAVGSLKKDLS